MKLLGRTEKRQPQKSWQLAVGGQNGRRASQFSWPSWSRDISLDWQGQLRAIDKRQGEEAKLKEAFLAKKQQAINLDIIKKQLLETQQSFGALLKQLPNKSEMDALLTDINQAGFGRGLQFDLFRPGGEKVTGVFAEQPISIRVIGQL